MVGIERNQNVLPNNEIDEDRLAELFESLLHSLNNVGETSNINFSEQSNSGFQTLVSSRTRPVVPFVSLSCDSEHNSDQEDQEEGMTILPKKKTHKDRSNRLDRDRQDSSRRQSSHTGQQFSFGNNAVSSPAIVGHSHNLYPISHMQEHASERHLHDLTSHSIQDIGVSATSSSVSRQHVSHEEHERPSIDSSTYRHPLAERMLGCYQAARSMDQHAHLYSNSNSNNKRSSASNTLHNQSKAKIPKKQSYSGSNSNLASNNDASDENNSEDEYYGQQHKKSPEDEINFERMIEKKGWFIKKMGTDGACLFRAIADQIYGDQDMHDEIRKRVMDYMSKNSDHFSQYVTEDFAKYISRKRELNCHGNHLEIQAIAELYNRPVEIYYYDLEPCNVFHGDYKTDSPPIRLSYHGNVHYNSIREPYSATVGIGLGLPEFQPGLAEKQLLKDAMKASEECAIEEAMLKDKMLDSFWDRTESQIEEQVAQESYLDWLASQGSENDDVGHSSLSRESTGVSVSGATGGVSPRGAQGAVATPNVELTDHLPVDMAGWDEDAILAHVLAESTLDYYETLRQGSEKPGCSKDS